MAAGSPSTAAALTAAAALVGTARRTRGAAAVRLLPWGALVWARCRRGLRVSTAQAGMGDRSGRHELMRWASIVRFADTGKV